MSSQRWVGVGELHISVDWRTRRNERWGSCVLQLSCQRSRRSEINLIMWHFTRDEGEKSDKNCWLRGFPRRSHLSQLFLSCALLKFGHIFCDSCSRSVDEERESESNTSYIRADMGLSASQSAAVFLSLAPFFCTPRSFSAELGRMQKVSSAAAATAAVEKLGQTWNYCLLCAVPACSF